MTDYSRDDRLLTPFDGTLADGGPDRLVFAPTATATEDPAVTYYTREPDGFGPDDFRWQPITDPAEIADISALLARGIDPPYEVWVDQAPAALDPGHLTPALTFAHISTSKERTDRLKINEGEERGMGEGIVGVEREAEWAVAEFGAAMLGDARRTERLVRLAGVLGARPRAALAEACDDPAMLKAAYRFLENGEIDPQAVLASHVAATVERARGAAVVLAVQDTTHVEWDAPATAGQQEGLWVHSTLALTPDGVVQGVLAQEQWTRPVEEQGVAARRRKRDIADKESHKWLSGLDATNAAARDCPTTHWIAEGDRECDIYDVFLREREPNVDLLVRAAQDRALEDDPDADETRLLRARVAARPVGGTYALEVPRQGARPTRTAQIAVRWARLKVRPPRSRAAEDLPPVTLWAVWAHEEAPPPGVEALDWLLLTTLPIPDAAAARVVLGYYARRWGIEIV